MVGIVVTISPSFSLYKMVVLPAASRPTFIGYEKMLRVHAMERWSLPSVSLEE